MAVGLHRAAGSGFQGSRGPWGVSSCAAWTLAEWAQRFPPSSRLQAGHQTHGSSVPIGPQRLDMRGLVSCTPKGCVPSGARGILESSSPMMEDMSTRPIAANCYQSGSALGNCDSNDSGDDSPTVTHRERIHGLASQHLGHHVPPALGRGGN